MKLTETLAREVAPLQRDYIHAAVDEGLQPVFVEVRALKNTIDHMTAVVRRIEQAVAGIERANGLNQ